MKNIVNIINFVRAIEPRPNRNIDMQEPMCEQIRLLRENRLRGTFLLQYDTLIDPAFDTLIEDAASFCEIGLWLEIVKPQVEAIGLEWKGRYPWDWYNDVGFLIGYEPEQRFRLIDVAMERFKERFGHYPESVGSWHIDAVSLKYLDYKYKINAVCICRDQVGTDGYTMQGGYYNQAYYPSVNNMFCPAATKEKQINIPVFRMLGSDPVLAYDYQLVNYGQTQCPTLEPSQLARFNDWTDWFFDAMFERGYGLCFQYAQAGQENSFGWQRMKDGLEYQMPLIAKKAEEGELSVMTLGESGRWYKSRFDSTPAATAVGLGAWRHPHLSSMWYYCKRYRVNLFLDGKVARFRDTYIFDENYREHYLDTRCDTHACEFRNLPVMDGVIYSNAAEDILAGVYFTCGGERIEWDEMRYRELSESLAEVTLISADGCARVVFSEGGIEISSDIDGFALTPEYDKDRVYGYVNEGDKFANSNNKKTALSFIDRAAAEKDRIVFSINGFEYGVKAEEGKIGENFSISASDGKIKLLPF